MPPPGAGVGCCHKPLQVAFISLSFLDDHGLLKDAWDDASGKPEWRNTGALFTHPDWVGSKAPNPVSYSMAATLEPKRRNPVRGALANRIKMGATVSVSVSRSCACSEKCQIYGIGRGPGNSRAIVFKSGWLPFSPSPNPVDIPVAGQSLLPLKVSGANVVIDWYIKSDPNEPRPSYPKMTSLERTTNRRYVTFGPPDPAGLTAPEEAGVTHRRMNRSVQWVGGRGTNDHPAIINFLFGKYDAYTLVELGTAPGGHYSVVYSNLPPGDVRKLKRRPDVLKRLGDAGWSDYHGPAGAWSAADPELVKWGAECQAICRLVIAMLRQLGSTADLELVYAYADYGDPNTAIVKADADMPRSTPIGPNPALRYVLVDAPVQKGKRYTAPIRDPADGKLKVPPGYKDSNSVGWNTFEAYLRYRYENDAGREVTRWYGGGVGEHRGNPIHVFWGIAEYQEGTDIIFDQQVDYREITGVYEYVRQRYQ